MVRKQRSNFENYMYTRILGIFSSTRNWLKLIKFVKEFYCQRYHDHLKKFL